MTPVKDRNEKEQFQEHMNQVRGKEEEQLEEHAKHFVFRERHEEQIKAAKCGVCLEPLGFNCSDADERAAAAQGTPFYVDYCGNDHYFHKWCASIMLRNVETTSCPDCRREPTDNARIAIAESYPMPEAPEAPAPAAPAAPAPAPAAPTTRLPSLRRGEQRLGAQRATDRLIQWHFWLKPAEDAARRLLNQPDVNSNVRQTFMQYMLTHFNSAQYVSNWNRRLEVTATRHYAQFVGDTEPSGDAPVILVTCKVWLPAIASTDFLRFFTIEKRNNGMGSMIRRWLSIIGADTGAPGEEMTAVLYGQWSYLRNRVVVTPDRFIMVQAGYVRWRPYSLEDDPMSIVPGRKGPQSATDVPIEWCLWVKGTFPEDVTIVARHVRAHLYRWFHNQGVFQGDAVASLLDIRQRLSVAASTGSQARHAVAGTTNSPVSRIDCQLYLPSMALAQAFVDACKRIADEHRYVRFDSFESVMGSIVGVTGARMTDYADFPTIRPGPLRVSRRLGGYPYEMVNVPSMSWAAYDAWDRHTFLELPPVIEAS